MKELFNLGKSDLIKGSIMAALSAIVAGVTEILTGLTSVPVVYPNLVTIEHLVLVGISAFGIYLAKNFLTNSEDKFLKKEPTK
jgi:hypothetical protein